MFDAFARGLLIDVPELEGLTGDAVAQALSRAYLLLMQRRTNDIVDSNDIVQSIGYLRKLANTVLFHVVWNDSRTTQERRSASFIAAESLALLAEHISLSAHTHENAYQANFTERFVRVESGLLYLFAEYDACASGVLTVLPLQLPQESPIDHVASNWCLAVIEELCRIKALSRVSTPPEIRLQPGRTLNPNELARDTVSRLYIELGMIVAEFRVWLGNGSLERQPILDRLLAVFNALRPHPSSPTRTGNDYARIFHLASLLKLCLPDISDRALCHVVPPPDGSDVSLYEQYLSVRATGDGDSGGRPLLWPSALKYVRECILGDVQHAVVSMPTGSGKSFVAELAVSQAIHAGWVLYLAPTNALAEQIRSDLRLALSVFDTEILAFIGDQEYSVFTTDTVSDVSPNTVAVMTPEKCSLALRLSPDAFGACTLVVFDECHLIGDAGSLRGPTAELVISMLMLRAPSCRFLLMSAIIQNPDELAEWLQHATQKIGSALVVKWRPTRTMRSVLALHDASFQTAATAAQAELAEMRDSRKNLPFTSKCVLAACLQGAWRSEDESDYGVVEIDCDADLSVSREKQNNGKWKYSLIVDSWVNGTAINLATVLAQRGIQTLVFTPASRHYPFSNGVKVELDASTLGKRQPKPDVLEVFRVLAEYEFGCESLVFTLLERGVAPHTSLMLEVEKLASEVAFKKSYAPVMFATGTMAQGLNLPAIAVVIAGTRIGDPRGEDADIVEQRKYSQLLNAAGRAGRAGFANQGIVIAIPDRPCLYQSFNDTLAIREANGYLQQSDDAVQINSGLESFLDSVCREVLSTEHASEIELQVVAALAGGDETQLDPKEVLQSTFAAYKRVKNGLSSPSAANIRNLIATKDAFIVEANAPPWLAIAAQRGGLDFFATLGIFSAWQRYRPELPDDVVDWSLTDWLDEFLAAVALVPFGFISRLLPADKLVKASDQFQLLFKTQANLFFARTIDWNAPAEWLEAWKSVRAPLESWMRGDPIVNVASVLLGVPVEQINGKRTQVSPIPKTLSVCTETWSGFALLAGGFLAIAEQMMEVPPFALACLPMSIKYGCDTPGALGWFRFGVRLRRASRWLAERFPPPPEIATDEEMKTWVRNARGEWLNEEEPSATQLQISGALREFITR